MSPRLSARQEQCIRLTAFRTDKEIAAHLGISEATVKKHVHDACQKLGVNRRKAALAILVPETQGYPKDPMAERAAIASHPIVPERGGGDIDHGERLEIAAATDAGGYRRHAVRDAESTGSGDDAPRSATRFGYRPPAGGAVVRLMVSTALMLVIVAILAGVTGMVGNFQKSVRDIDTAEVQPVQKSN